MNSQVHRVEGRLQISGEMTIYTCETLASEVLAALEGYPGSAGLDLGQITEIDTAGLQLLLLARMRARTLGSELTITNASVAVAEVLEMCGLTGLLATEVFEVQRP